MINVVAIITPYKKNGNLDWLNLNFLINFHIYNKTKKILLFGTTGESHNFEKKDYINLVLFIKKYKINFFFNICKNNLQLIYYLMFIFKINNIKNILISIPQFILPNNLSIFNYFKKLNKFGINIIFYNIPKRSSKKIPFLVFNKIIKLKFFFYVKNSLNNIKNNLIFKKKPILIFSGEDKNLFQKEIFFYGTISVFNNIIPKTFNFLNKKLNFFINKMDHEINPVLIKNLLKKSYLIKGFFNLFLFGKENFFFTQSQT